MSEVIRMAMVADGRGLGPYAALLASILRRTRARVEARCWGRGFRARSFEQGRLKVEFRELEMGGDGAMPVEMLGLLEQCGDWDRCFVLPKDAVVLRDLSELVVEEFEGALLLGRVVRPEEVSASLAQEYGLSFPAGDGRACLSPQLNLAGIREEGVLGDLAASAKGGARPGSGVDGLFRDRVKGVADHWALVHDEWDAPGGECARRDGVERVDEAGMPWRNGVPAGVIRWAGWDKPWGRLCKAVRREIWRAEQVSWEHLRMGLWDKPELVEADPEDARVVEAMAERGWKVRVMVSPGWERPEVAAFPDVMVEEQARLESAPRELRLGMWMEAGEWLAGQEVKPECVVVKGWMSAGQVDGVRRRGYGRECRLLAREWAFGGPAAEVLEQGGNVWGTGLEAGEWLYLWKSGTERGVEEVEGSDEAAAWKDALPKVAVVAMPGDGRATRAWATSVGRNFCPQCEVGVFRFENGCWEMCAGDVWTVAEPVRAPEVGATKGIGGALEEVGRFLAELGGWEFGYVLRPRVRVMSPVGGEVRVAGLAGVLHPAYHEARGRKLPFDRRSESAARVEEHEGWRYFTAMVMGGGREAFLSALGRMAEMARRNEAAGVSDQWGVESYWNRCLVEGPPEVVLNPGYARYERQAVEFDWKIGVMPEKE